MKLSAKTIDSHGMRLYRRQIALLMRRQGAEDRKAAAEAKRARRAAKRRERAV